MVKELSVLVLKLSNSDLSTGYMDVSIATSDDEKAVFHTEITIGDTYQYAQAHQQNYSVPIVSTKCF